MSEAKISEAWPEYLMIRDTQLHDDAGGLGQRIFTTAGTGYEKVKYIRADLAHLHPQPAELAEQQGDARAQFEAWAKSHGWEDGDFIRGTLGHLTADDYPNSHLDALWNGWHAALAATGKQQVGEVQGDGLLPCPFCGSEDAEMQQCQAEHYVQCLECEGATALFSSRREARELWNRRVTLAARQPGAQAPVASIDPRHLFLIAGKDGTLSGNVLRFGASMQPGDAPLYVAPPAQGIDLGQLRALAEKFEGYGDDEIGDAFSGPYYQCAAELRGLIDGQRDAAPGVGNG